MTHTSRYGASAIHDGDTLYGEDGLVYGFMESDRRLTWILLVDWDNDGEFTGENEAGHIFDMDTENGRMFYMNGDSSGPEPVLTGEAHLKLRNHDGRYDPYNSSGPLYGQILPGRKFQLEVLIEATQVREPILSGRVKDIRPIYGEVDTVKMDLVNLIDELKDVRISTEVLQAIRFDDAIAAALVAFGWTGPTDVDTTVSEAMNYWWASGRAAFTEITSIVDAALGMFCISEDGKPTYKSRVSADVPLITVTGQDVQQEYGIRTPAPWEVIKNDIRVYARARLQAADEELWRSNDLLLILPGQSRDVWARFNVNGEDAVATAVTVPVATTDFTFNASSDGSGADLTGDISISLPVSNVFATTAKMTITNNGGVAAYRTLLKLRGDAIIADKYTFVEDVDQASIDEFQRHQYEVQSDWLQDLNTAADELDILLSRLASQRQFPRYKIEGKPELQFAGRLFGLLQVDFVKKGITGEFRLGYVKHRWMDETGETVITEHFLEPNLLGNTSGTWIFPATFGVTTVF